MFLSSAKASLSAAVSSKAAAAMGRGNAPLGLVTLASSLMMLCACLGLSAVVCAMERLVPRKTTGERKRLGGKERGGMSEAMIGEVERDIEMRTRYWLH